MALTDTIKTKAEKMNEVLMKVPDNLLVGPMIEWKKEYKRITKEVRRGRTTFLVSGQEFVYKQTGDNVELQKKIADMVKLVNDLVKKKRMFEEKIKPLTDAIKWYFAAKAFLVLAAEVAEKANELLAATPGNLGSIANKAIAWFQRKTKTEGLDEVKLLQGYIKDWDEWEKDVLDTYIKSWLGPLIDILNGFRDAQLRRAGRARKWVVGGIGGARDWAGQEIYSATGVEALEGYGLSLEEAGLEGDVEIESFEDLIAELTTEDTDDEDTSDEEESAPSIYTVVSGDTLGSIASNFGLNYLDIAAANNIEEPYNISVGQVLNIPT